MDGNEFKFKKSLGQNFLVDNNISKKIIEICNFEKQNSLIIEVGPGGGALTKLLIDAGFNVIAFEIDKTLKPTLDKLTSDNVKIIYEDFLKVDLENYINSKKYDKIYFVSNLPYYITTPIINKIINEIDIEKIVIMVQKEVGDRFTAMPCTKEYNSLSVFLQYNFNIKKECLVSKNCFFPKPNVDSVVLSFSKKEKPYVKDEKQFYKLVKDSFRYKRKTIKNNLNDYNLEKLEMELKKINKSLSTRAEELTIEDFINISNGIS